MGDPFLLSNFGWWDFCGPVQSPSKKVVMVSLRHHHVSQKPVKEDLLKSHGDQALRNTGFCSNCLDTSLLAQTYKTHQHCIGRAMLYSETFKFMECHDQPSELCLQRPFAEPIVPDSFCKSPNHPQKKKVAGPPPQKNKRKPPAWHPCTVLGAFELCNHTAVAFVSDLLGVGHTRQCPSFAQT